MDLGGELDTGGGRPDHEHPAVGELAGIAVGHGVSVVTDGGTVSATAGIAGRVHAPVASTTARA